MALRTISRDQLPDDIRAKPHPDETAHYFSYISGKGGCFNPSQSKQWLLVTNKRIIFEASVKEGAAENAPYVHQTGSIPMSKVSYVGVSASKRREGCNQVQMVNLRISSGGGEIALAIPTKAEAERAQEVIDEVLAKGS